MSIKNIEIQDSEGNIYYPHTDASVVKSGSITVAKQLNTLNEILEQNKTNILNKFNEYGKKDGTLQTGLNAEMLGGFNSDRILIDRNVNVESDFNKYVKNGIYAFQDSTLIKNAPPISWGILKVYTIGLYSTQEVVSMGSDLSYRRKKDNNVWSEWQQIATTEKFEVSTQNQWHGAWTTVADKVVFCERNGFTTHVQAHLGSGISAIDTVIAQFPKVGRDRWIYVLCEDNSIAKFYLGWDGKLYIKANVKENKIYYFDFSYRNN